MTPSSGLPHPSYFAFEGLSVKALPANCDLSIGAPPPSEYVSIDAVRFGTPGNDLGTALQYGSAHGFPPLVTFLREWVKTIYEPATSDWQILLNNGNTDSWTKVVRLLCNPGDYILTEQFTFPSAQGVWIPQDIKAVGIKMDGLGMRSDHLREVLANWATTHPGIKRPALVYIVPVGSNPAGTTMNAERRKEIYDVCVEFGKRCVLLRPVQLTDVHGYDALDHLLWSSET